MDESRPIKVSFSFYSADVTALAARVSELKKAGVMVRSATVLRALVYLTTASEMFAHAVRLAGAQALEGAHHALVTEIDADFDGDAFAPDVPAHWAKQVGASQVSTNGLAYRFVAYQNPNPAKPPLAPT